MRYLFSAIIFLLSTHLNGTDIIGFLKGTVADSKTHDPLHGVYIIYGKNSGTITDENGKFFTRTDLKKLTITFQYIGYATLTKEISIIPGDTVELNVEMEMKVREIDQIVISANRNEQKIAELTVSMDIIKASFLTENHITDAQEIINSTPGIEVMDGQASVRGGSGFSYGAGSRVLALIDGLPMVSADAGNIKWQFLPLENISQIEIIKGASSVLYGSSALNGIINFRSADAGIIPVTQFFAETGLFDKPKNKNWVWWDTPRSFSTLSFSHLQKFGNTDFGIGTNMLYDEGYRQFNGEKLGRLSLKLKHRSSKIDGLTYGLNINGGTTVKRDFVLWDNALSGALKQSESTATELHGDFLAVDPYISYKKSDRYKHDLRVRLQSSHNRFPDNKATNSEAYTLFSEYQGWYKMAEILDLTAGISENYSKVNSLFYGDHTGLNFAAFSQLELRPLYRVKAVAGVRVEHNALDSNNDKPVPIFRAGLNWQTGDFTFLRASFGQGYRYPSIAEKFASTTLGSVKIIPNPSVQPESGWSSELGVKQGIAIGRITGQADLAVFLLQNKELIEYIFGLYPGSSGGLGFRAANVEQSRIYGCELEFLLNYSANKINTTLSGGYTFIYPVELNSITGKRTDTYLKYRRKHSGKININNSWGKFELGLNLFIKSRLLNIDDVFIDPLTREDILPGFYDYWLENNRGFLLIDLMPGYKITGNLTLSAAVKNLTNTEYMGRPGDIQPQRNLSLRLSGKF
jgi:iron complex outermembrane receptor protein